MKRTTVGRAMMLVGGGGAAAQLGVSGLPQNHDDWMAVLAQILVAAIGAIINGRGARR